MWMTWKTAAVNVPFAERRAAWLCDPQAHVQSELERMTRRYASEILPIIGPSMDIPAPDVYKPTRKTMAWIMDTYAMTIGHSRMAWMTGKPLSHRAVPKGRGEATARGLLYVVEEACKLKKISLRRSDGRNSGIRQCGRDCGAAIC